MGYIVVGRPRESMTLIPVILINANRYAKKVARSVTALDIFPKNKLRESKHPLAWRGLTGT